MVNRNDIWKLPTNSDYAGFTRRFLFTKVRRLLSQYQHQPTHLPLQVKGLLERIGLIHGIAERNNIYAYILRAFPTLGQRPVVAEPKKVVYVWLHKNRCTKKYVGSTTCGFFQRCSSHIRTATVHGQLHGARPGAGSQLNQSEPFLLYNLWRRYGLGDFVCLPVSILPDDATRGQVREEEQRWIDALVTLGINGYNRKRAVRVQVAGFAFCALPRTYGYFDMERRVKALCLQIEREVVRDDTMDDEGQVVHGNVGQYFAFFKMRNLLGMNAFISDLEEGVLPLLPDWLDLQILPQARNIIIKAIHLRAGRRIKASCRVALVYSSMVYDLLKFSQVFKANEHLLPAPLPSHPLVTYKYMDPIGRTWVNSPRIIHQGLHQQPSQCSCSLHPEFIPNGHPCIITMDPAVLSLVYKPRLHGAVSKEALVFCWNQGAQFRPSEISTEHFSDEDREEVYQSVAGGLQAYVDRMEQKHPGSEFHFNHWWVGCCRSLKAQIEAWPPQLTELSVSKLRTMEVTPKLDLQGATHFFGDFHKQFVVTKVDKLGGTMVAFCRRYYVQVLQQDLQSSGFFCSLQGPILTEAVLHDRVLQKILPKFSFLQVDDAPKLAYAAVLVKMHKDPVAFRFLASCANYNLKKLGLWVTALCRGIEPGVQTLWDKQIVRGGLSGVGKDQVFFVKNSFPVVDLVKRFNLEQVSVEVFRSAGGVTSLDCTRMYSNMPQTDLKDRLKTVVFRDIWELHYKPGHTNISFADATSSRPDRLPVVKVYKLGGHPSRWYNTLQDAESQLQRWLFEGSSMEGKDQQGEFLLFTLAAAMEFLDILIDHAFVQGFQLLFQQVRGIPIGVSPGVYLANFYLFTFELQFLTQLATIIVDNPPVVGFSDEAIGRTFLAQGPDWLPVPHDGQPCPQLGHLARFIWREFRFTLRFVDDFESVANRVINRLLYTDMTIAQGRIHGIYGRDCPWEATVLLDRDQVPFMDVLKVFWEQGVTMMGTTRLYDKRRDRIYAGLDYQQYSHATTCLSKDCLYNIFTGQTLRFCRIIMDKHNFISEVVILIGKLLGQGFKLQPLLQRYKRLLINWPHLYGGVGWESLYDQVSLRVQQG